MVQYCYEKKKKQLNLQKKYTCSVNEVEVSHGQPEWNLTVYDKLLFKNKESINSVWCSATCEREMGNVEFSFPLIPIPIPSHMKLA